MLIKIAICCDNTYLCKEIKERLEERYQREIGVIVYHELSELLEDYEPGNERNTADLLLMDIDMDGVTGINEVAKIQEKFSGLKVIFITSHAEFSTEIFRMKPSNFLLKPVNEEKFLDAVDRVVKQIAEEEDDCFLVTFKGTAFKIGFRDILFFESEKRMITLHGKNESWTIYRKLDEVQELVPEGFVRCHQSYLVNLNEVVSVRPFSVELTGGRIIPVSRSKYKETKTSFLEFWGFAAQEDDKE